MNAVIYTRVSTDEQARGGYSLRDQEARLRRHCGREGTRVLAHFEEDHSAKTFDRPAWKKLMHYVRANRAEVDRLLVVKWDRFSRNATDALSMIRTLEGLGVEVQATEQPIDHAVPEQLMMLAIYVAAPEVENKRRSLATIRGMRRAMREGRWTTNPPKGYVRGRDEHDKSIIVPDEGDTGGPSCGRAPGQAPLIREAFRLAAHTDLSLEAIRKRLVRKGFRCSRSHFPLLLRLPVYVGKIQLRAWRDEPEEIVRGLHEGLVSGDLFQCVQEKRFGQKPPHVRRALHPKLPLRGHLLCPECERLLTGSGSTGNGGRYWYYHCQAPCGVRFRAEGPNQKITTFLTDIEIADEVAALYARIVEDALQGRYEGQRRSIGGERRTEGLLLQCLTTAEEKYVEGLLPEDSFRRLHAKYTEELRRTRARLAALEEDQETLTDHLGFAVTLLRQLGRVYENANLEGRDALLGSIFPGHLVYERGCYRTGADHPLISLFAGKRAKKKDAGPSEGGGVLGGCPQRLVLELLTHSARRQLAHLYRQRRLFM